MSAPKPAVGHMPFPGHRTVAEVYEQDRRAAKFQHREMTDEQRECDAREGSARLRTAINRARFVPAVDRDEMGAHSQK